MLGGEIRLFNHGVQPNNNGASKSNANHYVGVKIHASAASWAPTMPRGSGCLRWRRTIAGSAGQKSKPRAPCTSRGAVVVRERCHSTLRHRLLFGRTGSSFLLSILMALQTFSYGAWPALVPLTATASQGMTASGHKRGSIWRAGHSGNIHKLHFQMGTVTTGDTLKVSLQDVSLTTGEPDNSIDQSGTVVVADGDDNAWKSVTLGADRTVTQGDLLACVFEFNSYVAGNLNILRDSTANITIVPHCVSDTTGSWAKQSNLPLLAVEYSDGNFYTQGMLSPGSSAIVSVASNTAGADEYGSYFSFPFPVRVTGAGFFGAMEGDLDIVLYDSDGTSVLATASLDASVQSTSTAVRIRETFFPSSPTLAANTAYRVALKPTTTTAVSIHVVSLFSAAAGGQFPGGTAVQLTKRVDAGSWTQVDTQRCLIWLLLDQADDGAGGAGGLLVHPGMAGGMRG